MAIPVKAVAGLDVDTLQVVEHHHHLGPVDGSSRWQDPVVRVDGSADVQGCIGSHLEPGMEQDAQLGTDQKNIGGPWGTLIWIFVE